MNVQSFEALLNVTQIIVNLNQFEMQPKPPQQGQGKLQNLTREELKKIQRSMKRPEFIGLLNQYMVEISDPKNKAQYDEYLKQMEKEGELPKHMKLIKIKPQFCFRTHIVSNKNKKHEMKFFINMCSSEYIEKPSCQAVAGDQGKGDYSWKVPNSIGKIRYDQDKNKNPCQVVDCAFHPDTFQFAVHPSFQAMIVSIALESAEKQLGQRKESLSKDYVILKNVKCKGENGQPALLPIRYISGKAYNRGQGPAQLQRDLEGKQTKLQKQINQQKEEYEKQKGEKHQDNKQKEEQQEDLDDEPKKKLVQDLESGIHAPKYNTIYIYKTQYSDFLDEPVPRMRRKMPNTFSVQFKVPRMEAISQANKLQINENKILLEVTDKYYIDLSFESIKVKYPLSTNEAKAKFDKKKKLLKVQIPVDHSKLEEDMITVQTIKEQPEEEAPAEYIENQTWKNKVLEIPESTTQPKFIEQGQMQPKKEEKKLVEEIDEDDYLDDEQIKQKEEEPGSMYRQEIFCLKNYCNEENNGILVTQGTFNTFLPLTHIFTENKKQIILMIRMQNHVTADVTSAFNIDQNQAQICLKWENKGKGEIHGIHLKINGGEKEVRRIEIVRRVGFYVVNVEKEQESDELWGKQTVEDESKLYLEKGLNEFQNIFTQILQKQTKRLKQQKQIQKLLEAQQQQLQQENKKQIKIQEPIPATGSLQYKMQQLDTDQLKQPPKPAITTSIFDKLPFQFIKFYAPFVDVLN